jgi:hypothetical protein
MIDSVTLPSSIPPPIRSRSIADPFRKIRPIRNERTLESRSRPRPQHDPRMGSGRGRYAAGAEGARPLRVESLGQEVLRRNMLWFHLPIVDVSIPDERFEQAWNVAGKELRLNATFQTRSPPCDENSWSPSSRHYRDAHAARLQSRPRRGIDICDTVRLGIRRPSEMALV